MQWEDHIKNVNQKILLKYSKIKAIASSLTPHTKKLLINALVMPYLNYCSSAWASATQGRLGKLEKRLKNVHSFLGKGSSFCLKDLLNKNDAILVFKSMNHIAPDYMCSKFMLAKNSHSHRTRGATKNRITLPMLNAGFGQNTFSSKSCQGVECTS